MNWLTLVALSAAGASGAADAGDASPATPIVAVAPAADEPTPEVELDGTVLARPEGGFVQVKMEGIRLVLRTFDAKKDAVDVDIDRATVRLQFASRSPEQYTLVKSEDGLSLSTVKPIRAPHVFRANLLLFRGDSSEAVETYQFSFP